MVEMASIGPPSLGTITVVFATMDSLAWNDKYTRDRTAVALERGRNCGQVYTKPAVTTIPGLLCC